jgi:putative transcription factor
MNHQDWKPVVIHGKSAPTTQKVVRPHREVTKEQKLDQTEIGTRDKVSVSMAKTIQQGRIAKGFKTQKDLANVIGVPVSVINSYESGKAIPDNAILQKLRKVLGVRLARS